MEKRETSVLPESQTLLGGALSAVASKDIGVIGKKLFALNERLTGCRSAHFKNEDALNEILASWLGTVKENGAADVMIYLGDSGFSRLDVGINYRGEPYIALANNSSKQVKEKWDGLKSEYDMAKKQQS